MSYSRTPAEATGPAAVTSAAAAVAAFAARTARPGPIGKPGASLSGGAAGIALLHSELAATGAATWEPAHRWLQEATRSGLSVGADAGLFHGAPAIAYALHHTDLPGYRKPRQIVLNGVEALTHTRLAAAHHRIDAGLRPAMAEFDLISGLTGLGVILRRTDPEHPLLTQILAYLVRLTEPVDGLPGWWTFTPTGRTTAPAPPGGLGNLGMAHGITGPLTFLASCTRRGITVPGQIDAIHRICQHLDTWEQPGPWWPETLTLAELATGTTTQTGPGRPSWCYGTPGIARAQQLAAIALQDHPRRTKATTALLGCLTSPQQMTKIVDRSLCHGAAGLYLTVRAIHADALDPDDIPLDHLADRLLHQTAAEDEPAGYLIGAAGHALALHALNRPHQSSATAWEDCLLLT